MANLIYVGQSLHLGRLAGVLLFGAKGLYLCDKAANVTEREVRMANPSHGSRSQYSECLAV
jgi:hypothetical protein